MPVVPEKRGVGWVRKVPISKARRVADDVFIPENADEFLEAVFSGMVKNTKSVTIRRTAGERWPKVVSSVPGDPPENSPFADGAGEPEDYDDLPF